MKLDAVAASAADQGVHGGQRTASADAEPPDLAPA
jgi:hypothetical protein